MSGLYRVVIDAVTPIVDGGRHPAKTVVGEHIPVRAVVWRDGHAPLSAVVHWTGPNGKQLTVPMEVLNTNLDLWQATVVVDAPGHWSYRVEAWTDAWRAWREGLIAKIGAGQPAELLANDLETGARLLERTGATDTAAITAILRDVTNSLDTKVAATAPERVPESALLAMREHVTASVEYAVYADRARAATGAWYEMFPRSTGGWDSDGKPVHGTLRTAIDDLPRIAAMGFDIVYLTPIHPIGREMRKGRNNSAVAEPGDPGCPWAIGAAEGGHDAIHPQLGDVADFEAFVAAARDLGMEVALELALQCAPDHPWLREHPEWFIMRPDGTIACAEDPPRVWTDIHPLNYETDGGTDSEGLYAEIRRIVTYWISLGVTGFRVDNPHTKPAGLWHRLIWDVKREHPEIIFLAEAFTRPAVQQGLSKLGFTQTFTYFMWRDTKPELVAFGEQLVRDADFLRPNLFPSNHDVLPPILHGQGPAMFAIRAALAATLSPAWGVYSGYEICENAPSRPGGHSPADAEKYRLLPRDYAAARADGRSIEDWLGLLNRIRRNHPALRSLRTLRFHPINDEALIAFSKTDPATGDTVLCVVTLDPHDVRSGELSLTSIAVDTKLVDTKLADTKLADTKLVDIKLADLVSGQVVQAGDTLTVTLDPRQAVAAIYSLVPTQEQP